LFGARLQGWQDFKITNLSFRYSHHIKQNFVFLPARVHKSKNIDQAIKILENIVSKFHQSFKGKFL